MSSTKVFALIKSLNQAEKRYFKLFMKRYAYNNESSIYGQLFNYLTSIENYDKQELLEKNRYINPKQISNICNRLYSYILLSLRTYNSSTSSIAKINLLQTLINVEILISKGLYQDCWKMLSKAEKIAEENDSYNSLLEILNQKRFIANTRLKSKKSKHEIPLIQEKIERAKKNHHYIEKLELVYHRLYELFKIEGRVLRDSSLVISIKEELNDIEKEINDFQYSYSVSYWFHYNRRFVSQFVANWEKVILNTSIPFEKYHDKQIVNPDKFIEYRRLYTANIIGLNNLKQFKDARLLLKNIEKVSKSNPYNKEIDLTIFEDTFFFELESYLFEFNFVKAVEIIVANKERIDLFEEQMHNVNQQSKRYRIALSYFGAGNYEESLNWINRIIDLDDLKYRKDILSSVQLLNLLTHFELKNYKLVKSKLKSVASFLKKIDRWLLPEKLLIASLTKIVSSNRAQDLEFLDLKNKLELHFKTNKLDSYFFCYFDLPKWLSLKIEL